MKITGQNAKAASKPNTGLRALPHGPLRNKGSGMPKHLLLLALTGEVAVELGDRERSRLVYEWLLPYSGRWVVSAGAGALWPVDRSLGRLALAMGMPELALNHVADARSDSRASPL